MSDPRREAQEVRPVSWFSVTFVFIGFALFLLVVWKVYVPRQAPAPHTVAAEQLPEDMKWRATTGSRQDALTELREKDAAAVGRYSWEDKSKGIVRLPVERAMELTVKEIGARRTNP